MYFLSYVYFSPSTTYNRILHIAIPTVKKDQTKKQAKWQHNKTLKTKKALPDAATKATPGRVLSPSITPLLPSHASLQLLGICGTEC